MEVAKAIKNIVRAEREFEAAAKERQKAVAYESEAWSFLQQARADGREAMRAAGMSAPVMP